jgi:hypothetical protein
MKQREHILKINREVAENFISTNIKKEVLLTVDKWNEMCEAMENECRKVLDDLCYEIEDQISFQRYPDHTNN